MITARGKSRRLDDENAGDGRRSEWSRKEGQVSRVGKDPTDSCADGVQGAPALRAWAWLSSVVVEKTAAATNRIEENPGVDEAARGRRQDDGDAITQHAVRRHEPLNASRREGDGESSDWRCSLNVAYLGN